MTDTSGDTLEADPAIAQALGPRAARCGACAGCVRTDCANCSNCMDKPRNGGRGVKKQACAGRVCANMDSSQPNRAPDLPAPLAAGAAGAACTDSPAAAVDSALHDVVQSLFLLNKQPVEAGERSFAPAAAGGSIAPPPAPGSARARLVRCGHCAGCLTGDCGTCKNCLDKPKYGGPGIKKQACLARRCEHLRPVPDAPRPADELADDGLGASQLGRARSLGEEEARQPPHPAPRAPAPNVAGGLQLMPAAHTAVHSAAPPAALPPAPHEPGTPSTAAHTSSRGSLTPSPPGYKHEAECARAAAPRPAADAAPEGELAEQSADRPYTLERERRRGAASPGYHARLLVAPDGRRPRAARPSASDAAPSAIAQPAAAGAACSRAGNKRKFGGDDSSLVVGSAPVVEEY